MREPQDSHRSRAVSGSPSSHWIIRPAYPVVIPAVGAGDKVFPLVGREVFALDTRKALYFGRRDHEYLLPGEGVGPLFCKGNRVALAVYIPVVSIHLERIQGVVTYRRIQEAQGPRRPYRAVARLAGKGARLHEEESRRTQRPKDVEAAWREVKSDGCTDDLWMELAAKREKEHPEDSIVVYQGQVEPILARKNNEAYRKAVALLRKVRDLMVRVGKEADFPQYLEVVRLKHKPKRNFIKMLDRAKW